MKASPVRSSSTGIEADIIWIRLKRAGFGVTFGVHISFRSRVRAFGFYLLVLRLRKVCWRWWRRNNNGGACLEGWWTVCRRRWGLALGASREGVIIWYLGYGEPLIGFCPYLRHAHMSDERLSTVTWHAILFCWLLLYNNSRGKCKCNCNVNVDVQFKCECECKCGIFM